MTIIEIFKGLVVSDNAKHAQNQTIAHLSNLGFKCCPEYRVKSNGRGKAGRIDIVAIRGNLRLAIEFDRHSPREQSIYKLRLMQGYHKIILLRGYGHGNINDIDVFIIPVRLERW